jgi:hypothetical protein
MTHHSERVLGRAEVDFTCEGVSSLADFSALVNEVESLDPVARAIRSYAAEGPNSVLQYYLRHYRRMTSIFPLATLLQSLW